MYFFQIQAFPLALKIFKTVRIAYLFLLFYLCRKHIITYIFQKVYSFVKNLFTNKKYLKNIVKPAKSFILNYIAVPRFRHACRGGKEMKFFAKLQLLGKILSHCRPKAADGTGLRAVDSKQYLAVNNFVCDLKRTEYSSARLIKIINYIKLL